MRESYCFIPPPILSRSAPSGGGVSSSLLKPQTGTYTIEVARSAAATANRHVYNSRMADRAHQHSFLVGIEQRLFKTVFDFASGDQIAQWLRLLLEITAEAGDLLLISSLQRAGAEGSRLHLAVRGGCGPYVAEQLKRGESPDSRY